MIAIRTARDGDHLCAGSAERGDGLVQHHLAPGERPVQYLYLRDRDRLRAGIRSDRVLDFRVDAAGFPGAVPASGDVGTADHHRPREFVADLFLGRVRVHVTQLVLADRDDIAMLQSVLLDQLAVDIGAVGAVQILEERVVQDVDDQRVVPADGRVVDADVVIRQTPDRIPFLGHVVLGHCLAVK